MNHPRVLALAYVSGLTAGASAQIITTPGITANLDLTWQEDPVFPHNDNGVLEPGERALIVMSLSFTGQGSVVHIDPPFAGTYTQGQLVAFGNARIDITSESPDPTGLFNNGVTSPTSASLGPNANSAGTSGYGVRGYWRLGGSVANGQPSVNGFVGIGPGQFPGDPGVYNAANPIINLDRLGWAPGTFSDRVVRFSVQPATPMGQGAVALYLDLDGGTMFTFAYLPNSQTMFGSVDIPIVPAPAGLTLLGMSGLVGARRRRPRAVEGAGP